MPTGDDERETLRAEIARLRALHAATIESLPFDFWARDRQGYGISQNATARANWGDLLHKRPEDMPLPAEVIETWLANNRRALAGEVVQGDVEYERGGEVRHFHNILAPIRLDEAIVGTLGVNIDVTDQRRTVVALRESQAKLRMAVDAAGIGLWSWDPHDDVVVWEPALCALFGLPAGTSPVGRAGYLALVHPDDRERAASASASWFESGRWEDEYRIVRADGAVRWVMAKGTVVHDAGRARVLGAVVDVTDRRLRDDRLRQAQKLEAVGQLTAGIAHNFNNMLMGVLPNLELAARRATPELVPLLESAADSARRAAELVRQLMTYAGRDRPRARRVEELGPIVARAVDLCRTTFDRRIALEEAYEARARASVDSTQIEQALLNVLINARDALEEAQVDAPRISVSVGVVGAGASELAGRHGDHVRLRVVDNGAGMEPTTLLRMYEPFFTTKEVGKGTGLGLATTHAIVHEHGGFVACESTRGAGTTLSFYLPRDLSPSRAEPRPKEVASVRGTETVLVVDDEQAIRRVVSRVLGAAGYEVREAGSGGEALELLADRDLASKVALVLLDVSMPGLPRRELRARLRTVTPARVVYFTGYALDAADADPDDVVLEKPVAPDQLLAAVRRVMDRIG